jgi:glycosyltransferase involved in cell wall biosynthesis
MYPLVTVITATWGRPDTLIETCIPTVATQIYQNIEHIIVVDGYDQKTIHAAEQQGYGAANRFRRLVWLGRNWSRNESYGATARMIGTYLARGEFICYLDDDNIWDRMHVERLARFLVDHPDEVIVGSEWYAEDVNIVKGRLCTYWFEQIDTSSFMHRKELLERSTWQSDGYEADRNLVIRWLGERGKGWNLLHGVTMTAPASRRGEPDE